MRGLGSAFAPWLRRLRAYLRIASSLVVVGWLLAGDRPLTSSAAPNEATVYVAVNGSDNALGTVQQPLRTITRAAQLARPGTLVHVAPGTYRENVLTTTSGSATSRIHYLSDVPRGAKVISSGADYAWFNRGNYVDIEGFDIASADARIGIGSQPNVGYVRIVGNHVHDLTGAACSSNGGAGILQDYWSGGHDSDTLGNQVDHIGPSQACSTVHGIYHSMAGGLIQNNIVDNVAGCGIHFWHAARGVTVTNNLSFNNRECGITVGDGDAPGGIVADNFLIANNIVRNNPTGIQEHQSSGSTTIGSNNRYINNLVHQNGTDVTLIRGTQSGTMRVDPQMVNFRLDGTGDYHLQAGSPAIDTGTSDGAPSTDQEGRARLRTRRVSIGPFE